MMLDVDSKIKKKKGERYFELPEGLDEEWIKEHQAALVEEQRQKIRKKFEKDNEKRVADGEKEMKASELEERLEVADELEKKFKKENKTKKIEAEGRDPSIEKLEANLEKLNQRIETMKLQAEDKENNKEVALGTSKIVCRCGNIITSATANSCNRTTSTRVLPWSSPRSSTSLSSASSPKHFGRNSTGRSSLLTRTGSFNLARLCFHVSRTRPFIASALLLV